ncbi:hypothetical protein ACFYXC_41505 [Streptomyces sp. NPDC002701]|uniref:hypothetical protein n=1 Tax=Streptomyces sp. NPDC002701 TaxID=3364661 RepID=UPI0036CF4A2C
MQRILTDDTMRSAAVVRAQEVRSFSAAVQRLHTAVISFDGDGAAVPFITALLKLVEAQAQNTGRPLPVDRWAEILDESFPDSPA